MKIDMKVIKGIYVVIFATAVGLTACESQLDERLDTFPVTRETSADAQLSLLYGAYSSLYNISWQIPPTIGLRGDDVDSGPGDDDQPLMDDMANYVYDANAWFFNSTWSLLYNDITNGFWSALEQIEQINAELVDASAGEQYVAEIKVMIGFEMLQLTRLWGDILVPTSSLTDDFVDLPVTPRLEVLQFISDLMDDAVEDLPNLRPNQRTDVPGGVTRHTALAVKAMANLDAENWSEAANATSEIINSGLFSLYPDFYDLFNKPGELSDEILLEFQYDDLGAQATADDNNFNHLYNFYGPPGAGWFPAVDGVAGGWGFWEPTPKYVQFMLDRGESVRLEKSVFATPEGVQFLQSQGYSDLPSFMDITTISDGDGDVQVVLNRAGDGFANNNRKIFNAGKHILDTDQISTGVTRFNSGKNMIFIRYAEVLLMHAEALVNGATGSSISADEAVNIVRNRAGMSPLSGVTINEVLDEVYAEMSSEWGIRFAALVRNGADSELNEGGKTYTDDKRFLPYPVSQVDLLPQLAGQ